MADQAETPNDRLLTESWQCLASRLFEHGETRAEQFFDALKELNPLWEQLPHDLVMALVRFADTRVRDARDNDKSKADRVFFAAVQLHTLESIRRRTQ